MQEDETPVTEPENALGEDQAPEGTTLPEGTPSVDPLDELQDPEQLRGEAKKFRSIAQRAKKPDPKPADPAAPAAVPAAQGDAFTKKDLYRINSQKAMKMVMADPEMAPFAEEIRTTYVNRRGQEDTDAIFEDIKDAFTVVKSRKPAAPAATGAENLTTTPQPKPSSSRPPVSEGRQTKPLRTKPAPMSAWFPKKEA